MVKLFELEIKYFTLKFEFEFEFEFKFDNIIKFGFKTNDAMQNTMTNVKIGQSNYIVD